MIKLDEKQTVARIKSLELGNSEYVQLGVSVIAELPIAIVECLIRTGLREDPGFMEGFLKGFLLALICANESLAFQEISELERIVSDASANPES